MFKANALWKFLPQKLALQITLGTYKSQTKQCSVNYIKINRSFTSTPVNETVMPAKTLIKFHNNKQCDVIDSKWIILAVRCENIFLSKHCKGMEIKCLPKLNNNLTEVA